MKKFGFLALVSVLIFFTSCEKQEEETKLVETQSSLLTTPDLQPEILSVPNVVTSTLDFEIRIHNNGVETTAPITFYVQKMIPIASVAISDPNWTVIEQATRWKVTSNAGITIPELSFYELNAQFIPLAPGSAGLTVTVVSGTGGGEAPTNNNIAVKSGIVVQ